MSRPLALVLLLSPFACAPAPSAPSAPSTSEPRAAEQAASPAPRVTLPDGTPIRVEIAADGEMRAQGLMFRDHLEPDAGMLFLFESDGYYPFWMKNTRIALDILWIDSGYRIVHIKHDVPPCEEEECPNYAPGVTARYVLELAAGDARRHALQAGQPVRIEGIEGIEAR